MNELPRKILADLISQHGQAVGEDGRLCKSLLNDALRNEHRKEMNVLVHAVEVKIPSDLLVSISTMPAAVLIGRLIQKLRDEKGTGETEARWAVETWALALGVHGEPAAETQAGKNDPFQRFDVPSQRSLQENDTDVVQATLGMKPKATDKMSDPWRRLLEWEQRRREGGKSVSWGGELLAEFMWEAFDRSQGNPDQSDNAVAIEICYQHGITTASADEIIENVRRQWKRRKQEEAEIKLSALVWEALELGQFTEDDASFGFDVCKEYCLIKEEKDQIVDKAIKQWTHRKQEETERLLRDGETKLSGFLWDALNRTQGALGLDDTNRIDEICERHGIAVHRALEMLDAAKKLWERQKQEEAEQLRERGEALLSKFVWEALDRTRGTPTRDDTVTLNEIANKHGLRKERTKLIVRDVIRKWREKKLERETEGQTKLRQFFWSVLDRTAGMPSEEDMGAAEDICNEHGLSKERGQEIVEEVMEEWERRRAQKEKAQKPEPPTVFILFLIIGVLVGAIFFGSKGNEVAGVLGTIIGGFLGGILGSAGGAFVGGLIAVITESSRKK